MGNSSSHLDIDEGADKNKHPGPQSKSRKNSNKDDHPKDQKRRGSAKDKAKKPSVNSKNTSTERIIEKGLGSEKSKKRRRKKKKPSAATKAIENDANSQQPDKGAFDPIYFFKPTSVGKCHI